MTAVPLRAVDSPPAPQPSQQRHRPAPDHPLLGTVRYRSGTGRPFTSSIVEGLSEHLAHWGRRPISTGSDGERLLDVLDAIALTGRGGAHFPVAAKWRSQRLQAAAGSVVVANAAESEPASAKDAALIQFRPHLVLDGLATVVETVRADHAVIWLHAGAQAAHAALIRALAERSPVDNANLAVRIVHGPNRYLSGESSAIVRALSGGPALPQFTQVPATVRGVNDRPTLVHNVETLARVAVAARSGHLSYVDSTLLTVLDGEDRVVVEAGPRDTLEEVVLGVIGRANAPLPQAVLLGGYGGQWHPWSDVAGLGAQHASLNAAGMSLGAGVVVTMAPSECGVRTAAAIAGYLADNSARQCGPCLFGLRSVADLINELAAGNGRRRDLHRLGRFLHEISGRGACHHPDGAVRMVSSALTTFATDVDSHLHRGKCLARGVARSLPLPQAP